MTPQHHPGDPPQAQPGLEGHRAAAEPGMAGCGGCQQENGVPTWDDSLSEHLPEDGWRSRSVLPTSSSAFKEVTAWGMGHQGGPENANLYTELQPQCLGMAKIC